MAVNSRKEAIIIPVYKNMPVLRDITGKTIDDELQTIIQSDYFDFEDGQINSFYVPLELKLKKVFLLSVPKEPKDQFIYRALGAKVAKTLLNNKLYSFSIIAFEDVYNEGKDFSYTTAFIEGVLFANYSFKEFKSEPPLELAEAEIITASTRLKRYVDQSASEWSLTFTYVNLARDLINFPPNVMTPIGFEQYAAEHLYKSVKVEVLDETAIKSNGLLLIDAVGKGSSNPPRFIKLVYKGAPDKTENIALVGKGITFDSGGSNLKTSQGMECMKADMGGAATVFAVVNLIAASELKVNVHAYIPLAENIIGGGAMRPGDIYLSLSGKKVEVLNTDAEGRLILADALYLATKTEPLLIIDAATLTGACAVALGDNIAGVFTNRKFLSKHLSDVSLQVGEDVWELPLYERYSERLASKSADLQNMAGGPKYGGAIVAALFLKEFVDNYPWIHIDIAGPAFLEYEHPVFGRDASGFGVRLIYRFIKEYYSF
ncbi:MAG: leucyl aminopeptidase [Deferribacteraceae bacterium]|jgi:leucyl aminopeptidase|nr:leucyl aminopeptidase [Deferribacteraceae bacterium]